MSTIVNFRKADRLDANNVTTQATRFYGTASDVVLGEPNHWVHMALRLHRRAFARVYPSQRYPATAGNYGVFVFLYQRRRRPELKCNGKRYFQSRWNRCRLERLPSVVPLS